MVGQGGMQVNEGTGLVRYLKRATGVCRWCEANALDEPVYVEFWSLIGLVGVGAEWQAEEVWLVSDVAEHQPQLTAKESCPQQNPGE